MKSYPESKAIRAFILCVLALAFGIAYTQNPLYSGNQNTYFLHGLKTSGTGLLGNDWMANTVDPFPVFTWLVKITSEHLSPFVFYIYQAVLLGIYFLAILGIACKSFKIQWLSTQFLVCSFLIVGLHSAALADLSTGIGGKNLVFLVDVGVAQQSIISHELLPATFGVLLVLSIYTFLLRKPYLAVVLSALAAVCHSSYVLSAVILTLIYAAILFRKERNVAKSALIVLFGFVLVLPVLVLDLQSFAPTSPGLFVQAEAILAHVRIPQHAEPGRWFNLQAVAMLAVITLAVFLSRKKDVAPILLFGFVAGLILTIFQIVTSSDALALLFPWRVSTWLVPISWGLLAATASDALFARSGWSELPWEKRRAIDLGIAVLIASLATYGGWKMYSGSVVPPSVSKGEAMMRFVSAQAKPGQLYLVPVEMEQFRLSTGVPILVDWKTNPYKDREVVEWYERLCLAKDFYRSEGHSARGTLPGLVNRFSITHVVLDSRVKSYLYPELHQIYGDSSYGVFKVDLSQPP